MSKYQIPKIPLPVYKPSRTSWVHKRSRASYLFNPAVKYPIYKRLPSFWREEYERKMPMLHQVVNVGTKRPQHSGLWTVNEKNEPVRVHNARIQVRYPPESREGIWGGEGIIYGHRYARGGKESAPMYEKQWRPIVLKRCYYSEILDREIELTVTPLTLDMIDEAFGFDYFILKTCTKRLQELGGRLKREMLLKLVRKDTDLYPNDPAKREKIYNKYKSYVIPEHLAEWVGLTLQEAMQKQWEMEKQAGVHDPVPLLEVYTRQLQEELRISQDESKPEEITVFDANKS